MKRKKPIYKKWWFWGLVVIVLMLFGAQRNARPAARQEAAIVTAAPRPVSTPAPAETPEATPTPAPVVAETDIRPEMKEFLDSYEAFIDEYAAFMERYANADSGDLAAMMGDYASFMSRYADFAEKLDAMDEDDLTNAELAYYLEVTSRASQKLLLAAG